MVNMSRLRNVLKNVVNFNNESTPFEDTKNHLIRHLNYHNENIYRCPEYGCQVLYNREDNLKAHIFKNILIYFQQNIL